MILIVTETIDETTNLTLKWLNYYKQEFAVITNPVYVSFTGLENFVIKLKNKDIKLNDIDFVWFRRQRIRLKLIDNLQNVDTLKKYHYVTLRYLENHLNQLIVKNIKTLGCPFKLDLNKLEILNIAKEIGFKIPKSTLSESKSALKAFFGDTPIITKLLFPIDEKLDGRRINFLTYEINYNDIADNFSISFFQEKINKKYEIRVFYFNENVFCKAIFSQTDHKTKIDYRNYNYERPNRETPFVLTQELKNKIISLMKTINLNIGTIDIIMNTNNEFVFLEINPVGQFTDMSYSCNYQLEKKIAKYLINHE